MLEITREGARVIARDGEVERWALDVGDDRAGNPFCEAVLWPAADVVALGLAERVVFLAPATGVEVARLTLGTPDGVDLFGRLAIGDDATLYVLGWRDVVAVAPSFAVRWIARGVAIDGIVWCEQRGQHLHLQAEIDPPGGWVPVVLDAATGRPVEA